MRFQVLIVLAAFLATGCLADAQSVKNAGLVRSESQCSSLAGNYGVAPEFEDSYFVSLAVGRKSLDVTFGLADFYQPTIQKGVSYRCVSSDELAFAFQDDVGNSATGRLLRLSTGFRLELDVDESPSDDFVKRNSRRNYGDFELTRM